MSAITDNEALAGKPDKTYQGRCYNCDTDNVLVEDFWCNRLGDKVPLCHVCNSTYLSNATLHLEFVQDSQLYRSLARLFNELFQRLDKIERDIAALSPPK